MLRKQGTHRLVGVCGLLMLVAGPLRADIEAIRIEYRAEAACPSSEQFVAEVLKRTNNVRIASASEPARTFVVAIERDGAGYAGSLTIRERGGETFARKVVGRECAAVADALVLSTALAVDPTASDATRPSAATPGTEPGASSPSTPAAPARERSGDAAKPQATPKRQDRAEPEPEAEAESEPQIAAEPEYEIPITPPIWRRKWSLAIALGPDLRLWNAPRPALGGSFRFAAYPSEASRPFGSIGAELTVLQSLDETIGDASASFRLLLARPFACALLGRPAQGLELMPCLSTELGAITGSGSGLPKPSTQHRFWFALEAGLRIEKTLGERGLLGVAAGAVFPVTRYRFSFDDPETRIYEVPAVGLAANLRFGWHL